MSLPTAPGSRIEVAATLRDGGDLSASFTEFQSCSGGAPIQLLTVKIGDARMIVSAEQWEALKATGDAAIAAGAVRYEAAVPA